MKVNNQYERWLCPGFRFPAITTKESQTQQTNMSITGEDQPIFAHYNTFLIGGTKYSSYPYALEVV